MSLPEPLMDILSSSALSLNDLPVHCPRPDLSRSMSLPYVKKRLQGFRRHSHKRQRREGDNRTKYQPGREAQSLPSILPIVSNIQDVITVIAVPRTPSPTRKRELIQQWFSQRSADLSRTRHRYDSVIGPDDILTNCKSSATNEHNNTEVPDGKPLSAHVIDDFFKLFPSGGSQWKDSKRWKAHLNRWDHHSQGCSKGECSYCRTMREAGEEDSPLYNSPPSTVRARLSKTPEQPKESKRYEDGYSSAPVWRYGSLHRRKKGKEPAPDQAWYGFLDGSSLSPRTQSPVLPPAPRATGNGIVIRAFVQRQQRKPVRCSFSATPLDPRRIPVPALPDFYPDNSAALNLSDLSQVTGRPYGASPLEKGCLSFSPPSIYLPPATPELKPTQHLFPIPDPYRLDESSHASSTGALASASPRARSRPDVSEVQRGRFSPTLITTTNTTHDSALNGLLHQYHNGIPTQEPQEGNSQPRIPNPLLSPPDWRNKSSSNRSLISSTYPNIPSLSFGSTGSIPERPTRPIRISTGPAGRDPKLCTLSDTTGSPLQDCPVYLNPREARDRKNESMARRHWPGMCIWRYECDD